MKTKNVVPMSRLENGHAVDGHLPIGSFVDTQWGKREVIGHFMRQLATLGEIEMRKFYNH